MNETKSVKALKKQLMAALPMNADIDSISQFINSSEKCTTF